MDGRRLLVAGVIARLITQPKEGRVTVPGKLSDDLAPDTANSILKQVGLKRE